MIFFCIKKWFFNLWDHLFAISLLNFIDALFLFIPVALLSFVAGVHPLVHLGLVITGVFPFTLDNPGFSLGVLSGSITILIFSVITLTLFPGLQGLQLWQHVCFKTRMLMLEYLEEHPALRGKKIPWPQLLKEQYKKLKKRSLRNLIFPWKP